MKYYRIDNIKINIIELEKKDEISLIKKSLSLSENKLNEIQIIKRSLDSRFHKSKGIFYVYSVQISYDGSLSGKQYRVVQQSDHKPRIAHAKSINPTPVIVGSGPSGLFAAIKLLDYGIKSIILERGKDIPQRVNDIQKFWEQGILHPESNVQFGLGGAGTFSDGKLGTRIKSEYIQFVLETLVRFGADPSILIDHKPHLGTDKLRTIIRNIKDYLVQSGCSILFESKLTDIFVTNQKITSIEINGHSKLPCEFLICAIGNGARDTFELLFNRGVTIEAKSFAVGVRVEHSQEIINQYVYGDFYQHPILPPAEYQLSYQDSHTGRSVYSFCNCPGGVVVNAASEPNSIVTNGMSYSARNLPNANSALVVTVSPDDFENDSPLSGILFQRAIEQSAYQLTGESYRAPAMRIAQFLNISHDQDELPEPTLRPGVTYVDLNKCLPPFVSDALQHAMHSFKERIKGFENGIMIGVETRTSSPVRIQRNPITMESINTEGLYPIGEGAGYAGGIVSSAVDGVKLIEIWINQHS